MTMSEIFWTFVITSSIGLIISLAKMSYKSKCKECSFCCIKIIRDTALEEKELEFQVKHGLAPIIQPTSPPKLGRGGDDVSFSKV